MADVEFMVIIVLYSVICWFEQILLYIYIHIIMYNNKPWV